MSDAELAQGIAGGQRDDAEAELFRRLAPRIRLYGLRHLRSAAAADDLVQQVLLTTIEALRAGRLRDSEKLAQFVLGTCRLTTNAWRRTSRRQQRLLDEFGWWTYPSTTMRVPSSASSPSNGPRRRQPQP